MKPALTHFALLLPTLGSDDDDREIHSARQRQQTTRNRNTFRESERALT